MPYTIFAKNLEQHMRAKGMTQQSLADAIGVVTQGSIGKYLKDTIPRADIAVAIADYFGDDVKSMITVDRTSQAVSA